MNRYRLNDILLSPIRQQELFSFYNSIANSSLSLCADPNPVKAGAEDTPCGGKFYRGNNSGQL
jgi:hypothetical protein